MAHTAPCFVEVPIGERTDGPLPKRMRADVLRDDHHVPYAAKAFEALARCQRPNPPPLELTVHEELRHIVFNIWRTALSVYDGEAGQFTVYPDEEWSGRGVFKIGSKIVALILASIGKRPTWLIAHLFAHFVDVVAAHPLHDGKLFNCGLAQLNLHPHKLQW